MDAREAALRRVWRLAALLTGDDAAARALTDDVLRVDPKPERLPPGRLDRLVIIRSREMRKRRPSLLDRVRRSHRASRGQQAPPVTTALFSGPARDARRALLDASRQALEAWCLRDADRMDEREVAKSMDCSLTAARRHLARADAALASLGDRREEAVRALLAQAAALDPAAAVAEVTTARRRRAWGRAAGVLVGVAVLIGAGVAVWAALR